MTDSEGMVKAWIIAKVPEVSGAVYLGGPPRQELPTFPFIVLNRIGGVPDAMHHDYPEMMIEIVGKDRGEAGNISKLLAMRIMDTNDTIAPLAVVGGVVKGALVHQGPRPMYPALLRGFRYEVHAGFMLELT